MARPALQRSQAADRTRRWRASIRRVRPSSRRWRWPPSTPGIVTPEYQRQLHGLDHSSATTRSIAGRKTATAHVDLHRGIADSCDVFFYETARRFGIDRHRGRRAQAGPRRADRYRNSRRSARLHSRPRMEEKRLRRRLAARRNAQHRHRPGLCARRRRCSCARRPRASPAAMQCCRASSASSARPRSRGRRCNRLEFLREALADRAGGHERGD